MRTLKMCFGRSMAKTKNTQFVKLRYSSTRKGEIMYECTINKSAFFLKHTVAGTVWQRATSSDSREIKAFHWSLVARLVLLRPGVGFSLVCERIHNRRHTRFRGTEEEGLEV